MINHNASAIKVSPQSGDFDRVTALQTTDFKLPKNTPFTLCNEAEESVTLDVIPAARKTGIYVTKKFYPGDNTYQIKAIKKQVAVVTLVWMV